MRKRCQFFTRRGNGGRSAGKGGVDINNADVAGRRRRIRRLEHGGATREEAMQQPTSTREAQRKERDGGVTREGRGGMARFCMGSTTKGDAARQQVI